MTLIKRLRKLILAIAGKLEWLPPTLARLCVGWVFVASGWGKLHNVAQVTEYFRSLGIPAPEIQAPFAAGTELVCGALILIGLLTRVSSVPLIITMVVAIATAKKPDLHGLDDLYGFIEYLYILLLLWLGVAGPGPISLDRILGGKLFKDEAAPAGGAR